MRTFLSVPAQSYFKKLLFECSDIDVTSNLVFEDNEIRCTNAGVLPHGNSASFFDWANVPHSANWSYSRK